MAGTAASVDYGPDTPRWPGNLVILAVDIIVVQLLIPTTAIGVALVAACSAGLGLAIGRYGESDRA